MYIFSSKDHKINIDDHEIIDLLSRFNLDYKQFYKR